MPIQLVEHAVVAGRFRLERMIGRGGMGSVWQANHLGLDIPCAVKFIEGEYSRMAEAQTRFEREAKAAAQLRSPHVVQILDHGVCEGTPYIAMELLDGEDVGKRLQRQGKLHPRDVNTIITQVCRALTKAHSLGIVHRDLKPDNIFLVKDDDREIAKVLDFGIAKQNSTALEGSNTKTGAMLGTPYYMSPEQAQGVKSIDYRSDLWSLAVIVYQCVTGYLPFDSDALGDLLVKIIVQPIPVPSMVAEVPPGFDAWFAKAASRDPAGRFQSAKEFSESLQLVFGASQVTDVMDRGQLKDALGGTPNPIGARLPYASHPGMAPAQMPVSATTGAPMARTFAEGAPPPKANKGPMIAGIAGAVVVLGAVAAFMMRPKPAADVAAAPVGIPSIVAAAVAAPPAPSPPPPPPAAAPPEPTPSVAAEVKPAAAADDSKSKSHHGAAAPKGAPPAAAAPAVAAQTTAKPKPTSPSPPAAAAPKDLGF